MPAVSKVLVVGAGTAGAATAIFLAREGIAVDLVEVQPQVTALGSGITLHGNALRVLKQLGVVDEILAAGYSFDGFAMRAPDAHSTLLAELPAAKTGGPDLPAMMGILRPGPGHQDARQVGPEYAHHGGQVRAAGLDRGKLGEQRAVRVRRAHREPAEWVPGRENLIRGP